MRMIKLHHKGKLRRTQLTTASGAQPIYVNWAETLEHGDGVPVISWPSEFGGAMAGHNGPTMDLNGFNGRKAVAFDGTSQALIVDSLIPDGVATGPGISVVVAMYLNSESGTRDPISFGTSDSSTRVGVRRLSSSGDLSLITPGGTNVGDYFPTGQPVIVGMTVGHDVAPGRRLVLVKNGSGVVTHIDDDMSAGSPTTFNWHSLMVQRVSSGTSFANYTPGVVRFSAGWAALLSDAGLLAAMNVAEQIYDCPLSVP